MKVITAEWLEEQRKNVCNSCMKTFESQLRKWKRLFPDGMKLTLKNIQVCADNNLAIEWLGMSADLLSDVAKLLYGDKTRAECDKGFDTTPKTLFYYNGRSKTWRAYLQHCVRPLWEAIQLGRKSK